ncbi:MAG: DUF3604 domain-containing protein [Halieaceae bacterium]|nr:DUF3604 domain-containing protein [Halieaceae bacterium]
MKKALIGLTACFALLCGTYLLVFGIAGLGRHEPPGEIVGSAVPQDQRNKQYQRQLAVVDAVGANTEKQILFGDLHVHSTFSYDAFTQSLPMRGGMGAHPPASACDFARYCSNLDFWSINDHAEELTPQHWWETVDSVRQCNARSIDQANPDTVAFLGWEWSHMGSSPENHYGHKNVVLASTDDDEITRHPVAARRPVAGIAQPSEWQLGLLALKSGDSRVLDWARYLQESNDVPDCDQSQSMDQWPDNCRDWAATPGELYDRLDDAGVDALVIPHGTTWGIYTPPGASWRKQLKDYNGQRESLIEVYSGHGSTERYFNNDALFFDQQGEPYCPQPTADYLPSCHRAGEIIRERCLAAQLSSAECDQRAQQARANYVRAGNGGHLTIPDATTDDWLDAGQCRTCFLPAFNYRPSSSVQAILATRDDSGKAFQVGMIASSDIHTARPGTGYKEFGLGQMTEGRKANTDRKFTGLRGGVEAVSEPLLQSRAITQADFLKAGASAFETARAGSFFYTGGLVAVHSQGRDRSAIWNALKNKEVYATSGPRMLLWFDVLGDDGKRQASMGSVLSRSTQPDFRVRAAGSFKQKPGCPDYAVAALGEQRIAQLCLGECYSPTDQRNTITRVEVVRIRPQNNSNEPLSSLIDDPWRVYQCKPGAVECEIEFSDPDFASQARDVLYYVRAIETPGNAVNGATLGCETNNRGQCTAIADCGARGGQGDDCLAPVEERAWSSPIFVQYQETN